MRFNDVEVKYRELLADKEREIANLKSQLAMIDKNQSNKTHQPKKKKKKPG